MNSTDQMFNGRAISRKVCRDEEKINDRSMNRKGSCKNHGGRFSTIKSQGQSHQKALVLAGTRALKGNDAIHNARDAGANIFLSIDAV